MKKVVVGMSGGVDSAVAAILLKNQGYEVIGLFMRNWDSAINNDKLGNPNINDEICPQEQDYNDALEVCNKIGIELERVDFVKEYWDYVFTYFLKELEIGRTPNPDIMCNKYIKFDYFVKEAKKLGADYIATGHYAIVKDGSLYRGLDSNKDQTYFLSQLTRKQLENVLFPVGELNKSEVRKIATEYNLDVATKKDSTGICFIGERNFQKFLKNYFKIKVGDIVDVETKEVIGKHEGLMNYTIGQRRGLGLGGMKSVMFVVGKDIKENILYISDNEKYLESDECVLEDINLLQTDLNNLTAKFRYRQKDIEVTFDGTIVKYNNVKAVTPGQACVFYQGEKCIGGGIIKEVRKNGEKLWYC